MENGETTRRVGYSAGMMKSLCAALILVGGLLGAAAIQDSPGVEPEVFTLDPVHSATLFRIHHGGAGRFWGRFNDVTGTVTWPQMSAASGNSTAEAKRRVAPIVAS